MKDPHVAVERIASRVSPFHPRVSPFHPEYSQAQRRIREDSEAVPDQDDRAGGLRHAALRFDGGRELRGLVAEALLTRDVEAGICDMNPFSAPVVALRERTLPAASWFTPPDTLTEVLLARLWPGCAPCA